MKLSARKISFSFLLIFLIGVSVPFISTASAQYYPISQFTLNVTVNLSGAGTVTPGSGLYYYGDSIVATEYTNLGYSFDGWYLNGIYEGKLSNIPLTMTQDYQLEAVFSKRVVALTITANPEEGGTIAPGIGVWNYTYGDSVVVKEFANSGFTFSGWYLDGTYEGPGTSITVTMNQDHQLNAFFAGGQNNPTPTPTSTTTSTPTPTPTPTPNLPSPNLQFYCTSSTTSSGFNVKIQGSLAYTGVGLSGAGILFSYSVTGGATWQDLAYVSTGDDGSFSAVWMPSASGDYVIKAVWPGDDIYSTVSRTVNFAVAPLENQDQNVFSVASNSTLTSLAFDSTKNELSFSVSGPSGTTGYVQVCIPKSLLSDTSTLKVSLDDQIVSYNALSQGDVWIITLMYHHSSHTITLDLGPTPTAQPNQTSGPTQSNSPSPTPSLAPAPFGIGSVGNLLGNQLVLVAIIAVLVAVIAVLIILNRRKTKSQIKNN